MLAAEMSHFAVGAQKWIVKGPAGCSSKPRTRGLPDTKGLPTTAACRRGTKPNMVGPRGVGPRAIGKRALNEVNHRGQR